MSAKQRRGKTFAVFGVFLLMTGLTLSLFDEAQAVSMGFAEAPKVISEAGVYELSILIPGGERVPIDTITAIIEQRAPGATDKAGAILKTRSTCDFTGATNSHCTHVDMTIDGAVTTGVESITFLGYFSSETGQPIGIDDAFGYGTLLGTTTGYGYDPTNGGFGYGYNTGSRISFNAGSGYGFGSDDGADIELRFRIIVNAIDLSTSVHYLTILAETGSNIIGTLSSPWTAFTVTEPSTDDGDTTLPPEGPTTPPDDDDGDDGTDDGTDDGDETDTPVDPNATQPPPQNQTVRAVVGTPTENGTKAELVVPNVRAEANGTIRIVTEDEVLPEIEFKTSQQLENGRIEIKVFEPEAEREDVGGLPVGTSVVNFVQIKVSDGRTDHQVTFNVAVIESAGVDIAKVVLVKWDPDAGKWVAKGRVSADGSVSSDCCSEFALIVDEEPPSILLGSIPDAAELVELVDRLGNSLTGAEQTKIQTITANVEDNLGVSRVEFYLDDALLFTDFAEPYQFVLNTEAENLLQGNYVVRAVAHDIVDNEGEATMRFIVGADIAGQSTPIDATTKTGNSGITIAITLLVLGGFLLLGGIGYSYWDVVRKRQIA